MDWATLRRNAGLSREQVCVSLGIGSSTLYRIETGKSQPKKLVHDALIQLYNVTMDELAAALTKREGAA